MLAKKIYLPLLLTILSVNSYSKDLSPDSILGFWLSENGSAIIEVTKNNSLFNGKLVWLELMYTGEVPEPLDKENPDKKLKNRKLLGLQNLTGFKFDNDEWNGGKIYDPKSGKTYRAYMSLADSTTLKLRGYIGVPLFGRTSEWKRQKSAIPDKYLNNLKKIETH